MDAGINYIIGVRWGVYLVPTEAEPRRGRTRISQLTLSYTSKKSLQNLNWLFLHSLHVIKIFLLISRSQTESHRMSKSGRF